MERKKRKGDVPAARLRGRQRDIGANPLALQKKNNPLSTARPMRARLRCLFAADVSRLNSSAGGGRRSVGAANVSQTSLAPTSLRRRRSVALHRT
jgi:hypothetical protein